jgi:PIN domain nuclease of toxin-antitoxin system
VKAVFDSSALLALLYGEAGAEELAPLLGSAHTSAVTWADILMRVVGQGGTPAHANTLVTLGLSVETFELYDAGLVEALHSTACAGWSLPDLAAVALAQHLAAPLITVNPALAVPALTMVEVRVVSQDLAAAKTAVTVGESETTTNA